MANQLSAHIVPAEGNPDPPPCRPSRLQPTLLAVQNVNHAAVKPKDDGYIVTFAYGRRGNTLFQRKDTTYLRS